VPERNVSRVHHGVLIPDEMRDAPAADLDAYAERVRTGNRALVDAYLALEDAAQAAGLTMDDLDA
jgi:hypothetical protein